MIWKADAASACFWIAAGVIWAAILLEHWENIDLLFLVSLPLLVWLLRRTIERLRTLAR